MVGAWREADYSAGFFKKFTPPSEAIHLLQNCTKRFPAFFWGSFETKFKNKILPNFFRTEKFAKNVKVCLNDGQTQLSVDRCLQG